MPRPRTSYGNPHPLDMALGTRVRFRRKELGMSQDNLARAIDLTFQQIQKYEHGANRISFSKLAQIATALKCSIADLTGDIGRNKRANAQAAQLAQTGAIDLLNAYASIKSPQHRRALIKCARDLAREEGE